MRKFLMGLALFGLSAGISAETVINYDDGSTYTLKEGQEIYISTENSTLLRESCTKIRILILQHRSLGQSEIMFQTLTVLMTWKLVLMNGVRLMCLGMKV